MVCCCIDVEIRRDFLGKILGWSRSAGLRRSGVAAWIADDISFAVMMKGWQSRRMCLSEYVGCG